MKARIFRNIAFVLFLFIISAHATTFSAQTQIAGRPSFALASVKPDGSAGEIPGPPAETSDYFAWHGRTLKTLMCYAYGIRDWQIEGAPDWFDSQLWDVEGKSDQKDLGAEPNALDNKHQHARLMLMLQSLLEDRFSLKIRRQTKQSSVYNLVVAKGGPKIKSDENQSPPSPPASGTPPSSVGGWEMRRGSTMERFGSRPPFEQSIEGRAVTIGQLLSSLRRRSDRPIIDCTNLKGLYSFKIQWSEADSGLGGLPPARGGLSLGPAFFKALQEQLGLRLESATGPVEFLAITSIQRALEK